MPTIQNAPVKSSTTIIITPPSVEKRTVALTTDERVCLFVGRFVYLSASAITYPIFAKFSMLVIHRRGPMSSSGGVAIPYVLPVL